MDKLTILNNALLATGNNTVNVLNDPSDEYRHANAAFDRAVRFLTARHTWPFATTNELLVRAPDADNRSRRFSKNGFRLPENTLHVKEVFFDTQFLTDYEIMGGILSCHYESEIYATIIKAPPDASWPGSGRTPNPSGTSSTKSMVSIPVMPMPRLRRGRSA